MMYKDDMGPDPRKVIPMPLRPYSQGGRVGKDHVVK
jgi:hypothetical protein